MTRSCAQQRQRPRSRLVTTDERTARAESLLIKRQGGLPSDVCTYMYVLYVRTSERDYRICILICCCAQYAFPEAGNALCVHPSLHIACSNYLCPVCGMYSQCGGSPAYCEEPLKAKLHTLFAMLESSRSGRVYKACTSTQHIFPPQSHAA
jgi:hypothetical protein